MLKYLNIHMKIAGRHGRLFLLIIRAWGMTQATQHKLTKSKAITIKCAKTATIQN